MLMKKDGNPHCWNGKRNECDCELDWVRKIYYFKEDDVNRKQSKYHSLSVFAVWNGKRESENHVAQPNALTDISAVKKRLTTSDDRRILKTIIITCSINNFLFIKFSVSSLNHASIRVSWQIFVVAMILCNNNATKKKPEKRDRTRIISEVARLDRINNWNKIQRMKRIWQRQW